MTGACTARELYPSLLGSCPIRARHEHELIYRRQSRHRNRVYVSQTRRNGADY